MEQFLNFLLPLVLIYGYPIIVGISFAGSLGIPVPATYTLMAAGSLTVDGTLSLLVLIPAATIAAVTADCIGYYLGRKLAVKRILPYLQTVGITTQRLNEVHRFLKKWGFFCVFLTRWLITPFGVPVNFIAGINKYSFSRFFMAACLGEFVWATIYTSLGYIFGVNWVALVDYINKAPYIALILVIGIISLLGALKIKRN